MGTRAGKANEDPIVNGGPLRSWGFAVKAILVSLLSRVLIEKLIRVFIYFVLHKILGI